MVEYFCHHLSDNNVDLSDLYVDLSDLYADLSDLYVDLSFICLLEIKSSKCVLAQLTTKLYDKSTLYLTSQYKDLTRRHKDLTS